MSDSLLSKIYPSAARSVPALCDGSLKTAARWPNFTDVSAKWGYPTEMKDPRAVVHHFLYEISAALEAMT